MSSKESFDKILRIDKYLKNIRPLLDRIGGILISFDPGYTIRWRDQTIHLPYDLVKELSNIVKENRR